jgi:hypothetical protein
LLQAVPEFSCHGGEIEILEIASPVQRAQHNGSLMQATSFISHWLARRKLSRNGHLGEYRFWQIVNDKGRSHQQSYILGGGFHAESREARRGVQAFVR